MDDIAVKITMNSDLISTETGNVNGLPVVTLNLTESGFEALLFELKEAKKDLSIHKKTEVQRKAFEKLVDNG